ncbi:NUDIX hydrolase [Streptomyces sp. DG2A-72]|uniref:NUDIX domain-containing protein n=1 Tax=Streptomyces sp. DG2A-72 TaxID=3051386 RepID=UPI00265C3BC9|nr:NUDIX domain-containing protein [Streptomyces sp. DG2A-72]MDO0934991.1 NUDIX hydrolase [Streptomyces sp. DG2A-72]
MSVRDDQIVRELSRYLHEHPADRMALLPVYDAARDHSQRRACTHGQRCPLVVTGAVVVDEGNRVLCLRHKGGYALSEAEPEDVDDSLSEAALRLLAEEVGIRDVWTQPGAEGPFLVDVTRPGQHRYGPRLRVGIRYLFRAHSGAVLPSMIETGAAAWVPLTAIGIPSVRNRVEQHLIGSR